MRTLAKRSRWACCGYGLLAVACFAGCQVSIGGQTLPSPYYMSDDVQYFPEGPEFILSNEAARLREQYAEQLGQGLQGASREAPTRR